MPPRGRIVCLSSARAAHHPRHHYRLARGLAEAGFEVQTLAQPDLAPGHDDAVAVEFLPVRSGRLGRMASAPLSLARALRRRPDAIYLMTLDLLPWAALLSNWPRRPLLVYDSNDEHDTYMLIKEWLPEPLRAPLRWIFRWLEPWLAKRLDAATTALPATQEKFEAAGVDSTLIRNFPPAEVAGQIARGPEFAYDVLLGGSLPESQIPLLAETGARLRELRGPTRWLVAVRECEDEDRELLERLLGERGLRGEFDLRYNVPFPRMAELIADSRIAFVLYPSDVNYASRIPMRIFEYMAAGLPFVASDHPTTRLFTEGQGVAVLTEAGEPAAFAASLAELLDDEERRQQMAENGPRLIAERYNWDRERRRLAALFEELLA